MNRFSNQMGVSDSDSDSDSDSVSQSDDEAFNKKKDEISAINHKDLHEAWWSLREIKRASKIHYD